MENTILAYAFNSDKKLVHIDSVRNGLECDCVCPGCGEKLVAKNDGKIREHHFAHVSGNDCGTGEETAIHLLAKEIIKETRQIPIIQDGNIIIVNADSIELEKNLGDIIPDVYAIYNGKTIAIEIFVTHGIDDNKHQKIEEHGLTTFEINLSKLRSLNKEEISKSLFSQNNIQLIYDKDIFESIIQQKKNFILAAGHFKKNQNGIVSKCPMTYNRARSVRSSLCDNCFLSFKSNEEDGYYCVGHMDGRMQIPMNFIRADINNNRFLTITEADGIKKNFRKNVSKNRY